MTCSNHTTLDGGALRHAPLRLLDLESLCSGRSDQSDWLYQVRPWAAHRSITPVTRTVRSTSTTCRLHDSRSQTMFCTWLPPHFNLNCILPEPLPLPQPLTDPPHQPPGSHVDHHLRHLAAEPLSTLDHPIPQPLPQSKMYLLPDPLPLPQPLTEPPHQPPGQSRRPPPPPPPPPGLHPLPI